MSFRQLNDASPGAIGALNTMLRELFLRLSGEFTARGIKILRQGSGGGALTLEKPASSALEGDAVMDLSGSALRVMENGGNRRGVTMDFAACGLNGASLLYHSGNFLAGVHYLPPSGGAIAGSLAINSQQSGSVVLSVAAAQGQTANLQEWRSAAGALLASVNKDGSIGAGAATFTGNAQVCKDSPLFLAQRQGAGQYGGLAVYDNTTLRGCLYWDFVNNRFVLSENGGANVYRLWHEGNDGLGSGLEADKVDGFHVQKGTAASSAAPETDVTVNYSGFSAIPSVVCQARSLAAGSVIIKTNTITATSFRARCNVAGVIFDWVAVG